jgi:small-conductance mechanosensitive channel
MSSPKGGVPPQAGLTNVDEGGLGQFFQSAKLLRRLKCSAKKGAIVVKVLISMCMVLLLFSAPTSLAQVSPTPQKTQETKPQGYPVVLGDQTLYYLRDIQGYSAEGRAKAIAERAKKVAEDPNIPITSVTTSTYEQPITLITIGNELLMAVFDDDAKAEGRSRQELATEYGKKLQLAITKYREERSLKRRLTAIIYTVISTLVLIALLYLLNKLYHKGEARIQAWLSSKKIHIGIQTFEVVRAERLKTLLTWALKVIRVFIILVIFYTYFHLVLSFFPKTEAFASHLFDYVLVPLKTIGGGVWAQIPNLLFVAIIALITYYVLKLTRLFFLEIEKRTLTFKGFYPEWAQPTYKICRWLVIAFAAVVAFPYIPGSDSPAFKGISIFVGVLFSLGSSSAIANLVAGFTLTYRRAFKVGDRIKIADFLGDVLEMRLQVTRLRTIKNEEIIVPNSMIVNSHVINYSSLSKEKGLILHTTVTIGYDAPWRQVHAMLLMAAERTQGLLREPPPFILQKSLDDFYVSYELNVYTDNPLKMARLYSELHQNIQDAFNEYGVQIMSPNYESDPSGPKFVPKDRWYAPPAKPPDTPEKEG